MVPCENYSVTDMSSDSEITIVLVIPRMVGEYQGRRKYQLSFDL